MLQTLSFLLTVLIAVQHLGFMVLEMFFWTKPLGRKIFATNVEFAKASATLAKNQGLYNGFLVAGLIWSLVAAEPFAAQLQVFFLSCVLAAGVYGGLTVGRKILLIQGVPAALALLLLSL